MEFRVFLLLILGGIFASALVIVIVFIIINMCIRSKVAEYPASTNHAKSSYEMSSSFKHIAQEGVRPPLPPRHQFDTESVNSYEEMPENPKVAEEASSLQHPVCSRPPETCISSQDTSASESYDDVDEIQNVQPGKEDAALLPDYLEVDTPQIHKESDTGSESYDDVDQLHTDNEDNEDYDDVG